MSLWNITEIENLLPADGDVHYFGKIFSQQEANDYFERLFKNIAWKNDEALIFGKLITTKRKVAWYADADFDYTYSNRTKQALPWTDDLLVLKKTAEKYTNGRFNACLLNLYHSGEEGVSWHSDAEKCLGETPVIASLSFGAERKFSFKHKKSQHSVSLALENGSLLLMKGGTQINWLHSLPKSTKVKSPRISLTFRKMFA